MIEWVFTFHSVGTNLFLPVGRQACWFCTAEAVPTIFLIFLCGRGLLTPIRMLLLSLISLFSSGITAHQFLELGFGARATAMAGAYTGVPDDVYAIFYNPAGLRGDKKFDMAFTLSPLPLGASLASCAIKYHLKGIGTLAGGFVFFSTKDIIWDEYGGKIGEFGINDLCILLSYAFAKRDIMVGMTGKGIYSRLCDYTAISPGFDGGILYNPLNFLYIGASLKDVGSGARFYKKRDPPPTSLSLGTSIKFSVKNFLKFLFAFDTKAGLGYTPSWTIGGEMGINLPGGDDSTGSISGVYFRLGYDPIYYFRGETEPGAERVSMGYGVECSIPDMPLLLVFDLVYRDFGYFGEKEHLSFSLTTK